MLGEILSVLFWFALGLCPLAAPVVLGWLLASGEPGRAAKSDGCSKSGPSWWRLCPAALLVWGGCRVAVVVFKWVSWGDGLLAKDEWSRVVVTEGKVSDLAWKMPGLFLLALAMGVVPVLVVRLMGYAVPLRVWVVIVTAALLPPAVFAIEVFC